MDPNRETLVTAPPSGTDDAAANPGGDAPPAVETAAPEPDTIDSALAAPGPEPDASPGLEPESPAAPAPSIDDTLSPAVRRLVRQYDLDITALHGTGPSGRIRVGDVMALIGRGDTSARTRPPAHASNAFGDETPADSHPEPPPYRNAPTRGAAAPALAAEPPATTVYECDLTRVLLHRKTPRRATEVLLTSYFLVACGEALRAVPEVATVTDGADPQLGVLLATAEGSVRSTLVDAVDGAGGAGPLASLDDRLRSFDRALRTIGDAPLADASLLIHHYGSSGSVLATPTPRGAGHAASVGIGRVRRQIVIKTIDGEDAPRAAAICYVTLTYVPDRVPMSRANRFLTQLVRVLEHWPD